MTGFEYDPNKFKLKHGVGYRTEYMEAQVALYKPSSFHCWRKTTKKHGLHFPADFDFQKNCPKVRIGVFYGDFLIQHADPRQFGRRFIDWGNKYANGVTLKMYVHVEFYN